MTEFDQFLPRAGNFDAGLLFGTTGAAAMRTSRRKVRTIAGCVGIEEFNATTVMPVHAVVGEDDVLKASAGGKSMFHLIWYVLIGLISGVIAKSVMHVHMTIFWTIVLGIIGSILGGAVTHVFSRPTNERYHPAGLIFSTLGAMLVLFICYKLKIHFPQVNPF
jgi:uncharacterized membrane protein YeaQ/YmgE (transglycosylase-associated protein family)